MTKGPGDPMIPTETKRWEKVAKVSKDRDVRIATVDAKGRVLIPLRIRRHLTHGTTLYLTVGADPCIVMFTPEQWKREVLDKFQEVSPFVPSPQLRSYRRVMANMVETTLDAMGRIVIPGNLLRYAGITRRAAFTFMGTWTEIWNPDTLERETLQASLPYGPKPEGGA